MLVGEHRAHQSQSAAAIDDPDEGNYWAEQAQQPATTWTADSGWSAPASPEDEWARGPRASELSAAAPLFEPSVGAEPPAPCPGPGAKKQSVSSLWLHKRKAVWSSAAPLARRSLTAPNLHFEICMTKASLNLSIAAILTGRLIVT